MIEEFLHLISTHVAPLFGFVGQHAFMGGTAVIVAPGLALTAKHVIQEIADHFGCNSSSPSIELDVYVAQLNTGACWYACRTSSWVGTDIAVLSLRVRNEAARTARINRLAMTVDPPPEDTTVTALGYPHTELTIPRNDPDFLKINFSITPTISEGRVIKIHPSLRDAVNLRFPCFAVGAEFTAGMSGGAVFNEQRELCGLVCSGGEGELKDYSNATSIWPMTLIPVKIPEEIPPYVGVTPGETYKLLDLARLGYL